MPRKQEYGLTLLVSTDPEVNKYLENILQQIKDWLEERKVGFFYCSLGLNKGVYEKIQTRGGGGLGRSCTELNFPPFSWVNIFTFFFLYHSYLVTFYFTFLFLFPVRSNLNPPPPRNDLKRIVKTDNTLNLFISAVILQMGSLWVNTVCIVIFIALDHLDHMFFLVFFFGGGCNLKFIYF